MRGAEISADEYIPELCTERVLQVDCSGPARYAEILKVLRHFICAKQGGTAVYIALELHRKLGGVLF